MVKRVFEDVAKDYPEIQAEHQIVDNCAHQLVMRPEQFDVIVTTNLFGDILSDLGPACTGTIGLAPSANLNPERKFPSLFEPVHGSAPDIAGKGIANPIGQIWSGAMMLEHLGHPDAAQAVERAIDEDDAAACVAAIAPGSGATAASTVGPTGSRCSRSMTLTATGRSRRSSQAR